MSDDWSNFIHRQAAHELAPCRAAAEFRRKIEDDIFTPLGKTPTLGQIAQAKFLLQEEAQAWRRSLPSNHEGRQFLGRHGCVLETYDEAYARLHLIQLRIKPPTIIADYEALTRRLFEGDDNVRRFRTSVSLGRLKAGLRVPLENGPTSS